MKPQNVIDTQKQLPDLNCKSVQDKKLQEASKSTDWLKVSGLLKIWFVRKVPYMMKEYNKTEL